MSPRVELFLSFIRSVRECCVGITLARVEEERAVGTRRFEQQAVVLRRHMPVREGRKVLDLDRNMLQRVFADRHTRREHHRQRLADVTHLVVSDDRLLERLELRQRLQPHRDDGRAARHVLGGDDTMYAFDLQRSRCVDRADAAVRYRAAQDHRVKQIGWRKVVDIGATATQEAQIFAPLERSADESVFHRELPSFL